MSLVAEKIDSLLQISHVLTRGVWLFFYYSAHNCRFRTSKTERIRYHFDSGVSGGDDSSNYN